MTEKQINQLKEILDKNSLRYKSPTELDDQILSSARDYAESTKVGKSYWFSQSHYLGAATLSLCLTVGIFIALAQLTTTNQEHNHVTSVTEQTSIAIETSNILDKTYDKPLLKDSTPALTAIHDSKKARDELLASIELPSVESLLSNMEFSLPMERSLVANNLTKALADINFMLKSGQLDDARDRYDRLRQNCNACQLPMTLEALAQLYPKQTNRS